MLKLTWIIGAITDYSPTMVHWMRHRTARYKGGILGEMERPDTDYAVDVCKEDVPY